MTAVLVDTDVLIEVFRRREQAIVARWLSLVEDSCWLLYTPVTLAEVFHGLRPREEKPVQEILTAMRCIHLDREVGKKAGEYLRSYHASHGLELGDSLIAASAFVHKVPLWTRNRKHYPMKDILIA